MERIIATFLLLGFISMVFCGFVTNHQMAQHAAHADASSSFIEHHFSMWTDFSTAIVTDVVTYVTLLTLVLATAFFFVRTSVILLRLRTELSFRERVPIGTDKQTGYSQVLRQWLSLFEHSPSLI
jgi:hypothetical protein